MSLEVTSSDRNHIEGGLFLQEEHCPQNAVVSKQQLETGQPKATFITNLYVLNLLLRKNHALCNDKVSRGLRHLEEETEMSIDVAVQVDTGTVCCILYSLLIAPFLSLSIF